MGVTQMETDLEKAKKCFIKEMGKLSLDERDQYPSFDEYVEIYLRYIPDKNDHYSEDIEERKEIRNLYFEFKKLADEAVEAAEDLAYTYRIAQTHTEIGEAKDAYDQALSACM